MISKKTHEHIDSLFSNYICANIHFITTTFTKSAILTINFHNLTLVFAVHEKIWDFICLVYLYLIS